LERQKPDIAGIRLISYVYLANAGLFFLAPFIFYSRILIFGRPVSGAFSYLLNFSLAIISLCLFIRLPKLKSDAFYLAAGFHFFSALNCLAMLTESFIPLLPPAVRITGAFGASGYSCRQFAVIAVSILLNFLIFVYIISKRRLFFQNRA